DLDGITNLRRMLMVLRGVGAGVGGAGVGGAGLRGAGTGVSGADLRAADARLPDAGAGLRAVEAVPGAVARATGDAGSGVGTHPPLDEADAGVRGADEASRDTAVLLASAAAL